MTEKERRYRRFSEEMKKEKVKLIEAGKVSVRQICIDYDVSGTAVYKWIEKYGKAVKPERLIYEKASETNQIRGLNSKIGELEQAVGKQQMEILYLKKIIEISAKEVGYDLEKKTQREAIVEIRALKERSFSMESLYRLLGQSRQNIAQGEKRKARIEGVMQQVKGVVKIHRQTHKMDGSRVMFHSLGIKESLGVGINRFEGMVRLLGLTIERKRSWKKTSDRCSRSRQHVNLINGKVLDGPNQLIVCDLTYIVGLNRYYVFAIKDVYTGRLVGLSGGIRMTTSVAIRALKQVFRLRGKGPFPDLTHHTDGGSQYFSDAYLALLNKSLMKISVAKSCLENGYAEQVNHVVKNNYLRFLDMSSEAAFQRSIKRTQILYNSKKVQKGLGYRTPEAFEQYILSLDKDQRPQMKLFDFTNPKIMKKVL